MQNEIQWESEELEIKPKTNDWYWIVGIVTATVAIGFIIFENILFAVFIILASLALVMQSRRTPETLKIRLTDRGIVVNDTMYPYNTLKSFWVEKNDNQDKLLIQSQKAVMPYVVLPIQQHMSRDVEIFLRNFLEEEELHEPATQKIADWLGF